MFKLQDSIGYLANRVAARMRWALEVKLAEHGLTAPQWSVLATLNGQQAMTATEIRGRIAIDKPTLSGVLKRLHGKGLLARLPDPIDGRATRLALTPQAQRLMRDLPQLAAAVNAQAIKGMKRADVDQLRNYLHVMLLNMQ